MMRRIMIEEMQSKKKLMRLETNKKGMVVPHTERADDQTGDLMQ